MPVARCVCVFEEAKSKVASSVQVYAGFASHEGLNVIKRNKDLRSGDFIVFAPSHRVQEHTDTICRSHHVCSDASFDKAASINLSAEVKDDSNSCLDTPLMIESTQEVERGKYFVKMSRPSVYRRTLRQVMFAEQRTCDRCAIVTHGSAIVNCTLVNDVKRRDCDQLTLDQLRLLMVSEHVGNLLKNNGFCVTYAQYPVMEIAYDFMNEHFGVNAKRESEEGDSACSINGSAPDCKSSTGRRSASSGCQEIMDKCRNSPYAAEIDCAEAMLRDENQCDQQTKVTLDLKRFISDHHLSSSELLQSTCHKNFNKVQFDCFSSLVCQIDQLESQRSSLKYFVKNKPTDNCSVAQHTTVVCVHVTLYDQEFMQQQVATAWHIVEPKVAAIKQVHVVCGPVSGKDKMQPIVSAQDYFKLKHRQMNDAFVMKYGNELLGEEWRLNVLRLTKAAVRFDLLSTTSRQQVKLDLSVETSTGDNKGGVFVMYNFARLSTLFCHFEDAVRKGTYPELPTIDSVDFSTLKQEEEWGLLFNYILLYPSVLSDTVSDLKRSPGSIQTHKICQFLLSLSNSLSSYYSKTHILCEPRPHLMPVMFARLYLMKAIRKVMHDCLNLLAIDPCAQL